VQVVARNVVLMLSMKDAKTIEIRCPHCEARQFMPSMRLSPSISCMHCHMLIDNPELHAVEKSPDTTSSATLPALRGRLVTEEGSVDFQEQARAEQTPSKEFKPPHFVIRDSGQFRRYTTRKYYKMPSRRRSNKTKVYIPLAVVVLLAVGGIGYAAWDQFLASGSASTEMLGEANEQVSHWPSGQLRTRGVLGASADGRRVLHGSWEEFHEHGERAVKGQYSGGMRVGEWQEWHPNGERAAVYQFAHGDRTGLYQRWHSNGNRQEYGRYVHDLKEGEWRTWHPTGLIASFQRYSEGLPVGGFTSWHPNGLRKVYGEYQNGQRHGEWFTTYDNGQIMLMETFQAGARHGRARGYYRRGERQFTGNWQDDSRHGDWTWWHRTGATHEQGTFEEGLKDGIWRVYDQFDTAVSVQSWAAGVRDGEWLEFDRNGRLILRQQFEGGQVTGEKAFLNGQPVTRVTRRLEDSRSDTRIAAWSVVKGEDGEVMRHGWYREYDSDGKVRVDGVYFEGRRHGQFYHYDASGNRVRVANWIHDEEI
jgi:antitoxin component YwqK of YwqJK toxin-antitoxin module